MATFDDFKRVIKDTVEVDFKDRWTNQLVKFIHHGNVYYGTFHGTIDAQNGISASGGYIENAILSCCTIYDKDGHEIEVSSLIETQRTLIQNVKELCTYVSDVEREIDETREYVDEVSSGLSILIDDKVAHGSEKQIETLSAISSYLQYQISDNSENIATLSVNLAEISSKIQTGVVYKGKLTDRGELGCESLANLFKVNDITGELKSGWMYSFSGNDVLIRETPPFTLRSGNYLIVNTDIQVSDANQTNVDIIDAQDKDVVKTATLSAISTLISNDIITERGRIDNCELSIGNINTTIQNLDYSNVVEEGKLIKHISQSNGLISVETTDIVSSYVIGLSDYVENKINDKIATLTAKIEDDRDVKGGFLCALYENNGIVSGGFRYATSSDFGLSDGVFINKLPTDIMEGLGDLATKNEVDLNLSNYVEKSQLSNYIEKSHFKKVKFEGVDKDGNTHEFLFLSTDIEL